VSARLASQDFCDLETIGRTSFLTGILIVPVLVDTEALNLREGLNPTRPARLETVQPVLLCWGLRGHLQTPPPEAWPLDSIIRSRWP
jgi:hypothetical protein